MQLFFKRRFYAPLKSPEAEVFFSHSFFAKQYVSSYEKRIKRDRGRLTGNYGRLLSQTVAAQCFGSEVIPHFIKYN